MTNRSSRQENPNPEYSVVIPTLNEGEMLHMTVDSVLSSIGNGHGEVIIVDDGSTDGSPQRYLGREPSVRVLHGGHLGVGGARNLGAQSAKGNYIVFLDAHCRVEGSWLERMRAVLELPGVGLVAPSFTRLNEREPRGCGMTWINPILETAWLIPDTELEYYPVPLAPGGCQAFRRETFYSLGGYDEGLVRWGFEDIELSVRVWLLGQAVMACPSVAVAHWFRDTRQFEVTDETVLLNFLRFVHVHFSAPRIRRFLRAASQVYELETALDLVYGSDVFVRRSYWAQRRIYTDDWFVSNFGLPV